MDRRNLECREAPRFIAAGYKVMAPSDEAMRSTLFRLAAAAHSIELACVHTLPPFRVGFLGFMVFNGKSTNMEGDK
ncbi:hypothetical protein BK147_20525 [Paenibacillus sp. FSL R7-0337]|nr:hypothetical protein BK147_20525 [Paenibacillus sp. FSL R7-0337]